MPGPDWQKFANVRLLYSYMIAHPGKKLLFMGGEVGQWNEWDCKGEIAWSLLQYPFHSGLQGCVKDLNHFYRENSAFWRHDFDWQGYEWIDFADAENSVISYLRKGEGSTFAIVHHFTPAFREGYRIPLKNAKRVREVFNTDGEKYGGSNTLNGSIEIDAEGFTICLAPLATMIFEVVFEP
jgi:1,4-alpha-glucan branching enzyme